MADLDTIAVLKKDCFSSWNATRLEVSSILRIKILTEHEGIGRVRRCYYSVNEKVFARHSRMSEDNR